DHFRLPAVGGDGDAEVSLQVVVAADVIAVMVRVDDEKVFGPDTRLGELAEGELDVVAEAAIDQERTRANDQGGVRAREGALVPAKPRRHLEHRASCGRRYGLRARG